MSIFSQIRSILVKNESEESPADPTQARKSDAAPVAAAPIERRSRKRINTHKGRRILIIDDSPTIVGALRKMLRSAGCITLEAADAESGLELIRKEKPELVFLDIVLPGMTGFAALRPGGALVLAHALMGGRVADPARRETNVVTIRNLGKDLMESSDLRTALVPVGDGLLLATFR